ncbi:unnamed protein product [Gongylonema pulchrum]|uniref:Ovule protein n=1 Tax=Gongylonema pulchrum TaxID=637853 RepID=A0A183DKU3_9BILA|nr:unnamed protein product [Gongylonema pulchrum]
MEWNRRVALEKELDRDENTFQHLSICFDETSNFLIYPTPIGIKVSVCHLPLIRFSRDYKLFSISFCLRGVCGKEPSTVLLFVLENLLSLELIPRVSA